MAKEIIAKVKLQCVGAKATPAPPVGPALSQHGVNIGIFVKDFNDRTRNPEMQDKILPVEITVFKDKSFKFEIKSPPAAVLVKEAAKVSSGSRTPGREVAGSITMDQVIEIARTKVKDINAPDLRAACRLIAGTARSVGVKVEGELPPAGVPIVDAAAAK